MLLSPDVRIDSSGLTCHIRKAAVSNPTFRGWVVRQPRATSYVFTVSTECQSRPALLANQTALPPIRSELGDACRGSIGRRCRTGDRTRPERELNASPTAIIGMKVAGLGRPEALIEIEAIAALP